MPRHLTPEEKETIAAIVRDAGAPEVLRLVAGIVGNDFPHWLTADELKTKILHAASDLQSAIAINDATGGKIRR